MQARQLDDVGDGLKYWAFISYSHQDKAWGQWLHRRLEGYRVPHRLIGRPHWSGKLPARLAPIFRDRDELPSSSELGAVLNEALRLSRYQIVICSPRSATSRWVDEEVRHFKSLGRENRVLCFIVDGEPNAGDPGRECFAPALRFHVDDSGWPTDEPAHPIAADARAQQDGREDALLKLLAGMLGIGFDELKQRERRRRFVRRLAYATAAVALAASAYAGWTWQQREKQQALEAQARSVRDARLYEQARDETLSGNAARAAVLLHGLMDSGVHPEPLRFMLARNLEVVDSLTESHDLGLVAQDLILSPDGSRLVAAGTHEAVLLDGQTLKEVARIKPPPSVRLVIYVVRPVFSADGRRFCLGWASQPGLPGAVQVYDSATGRLLLSKEGVIPEGRAPFAPLSPDGSRVVVSDAQRKLSIIEVDTGRPLTDVLGKNAITIAGFLSPDQLLTGDVAGVVALWDIAARRFTRTYAGLSVAASVAAISPDGRRLAMSALNGALRVWDAETGAVIIAGGHADQVNGIQFSQDGESLLSFSSADARVWRLRTGALIANIEHPIGFQNWPVLNPQGNDVLVQDADGVNVIDAGSRQIRFKMDAHRGGATAAIFGVDGQSVLTAGNDNRLARWRWPIAPLLRFKHDPTIETEGADAVWDVRFDDGGKRFVTAGSDGIARLFDVASRRLLARFAGNLASVMCVSFSSDGRYFAAGGYDRSMRVYDTETGQARWTRTGFEIPFQSVTYSPDGRHLFARDVEDHFGLLDAQTGKTVAGWEPRPGDVAFFSADPPRVLWASAGKLSAYDAGTLALLWEHQFPAENGAPARVWAGGLVRANRILAGTRSGDALLLDIADGKLVATYPGHGTSFYGGRLTRDGRHAALVSSVASPVIWDIASGTTRVLAQVKGSRFRNPGMVGNSIVVFGGSSGLLEAWDAASGQRLGIIGHHGSQIREFDKSRDDLIVSASADNTASLWAANLETRDATAVGALLACKAPWELKDDELVARDVDPDRCD